MIGRLASGEIGTSARAILQVVGDRQVLVHSIYVVNGSSALRRVRVHHAQQGESAALGNAMLYDAAVASKSTLVDATRFVLGPGDSIIASADGDDVAITVEGQRAL